MFKTKTQKGLINILKNMPLEKIKQEKIFFKIKDKKIIKKLFFYILKNKPNSILKWQILKEVAQNQNDLIYKITLSYINKKLAEYN